MVRIYEAIDSAKLSIWQLQQEFVADAKTRCCHALSWNTSPFDPQQIAVGTAAGAAIWQFEQQQGNGLRQRVQIPIPPENERELAVLDVQWANNIGRPHHLIACACQPSKLFVAKIYLPKNDNDAPECKIFTLSIERDP